MVKFILEHPEYLFMLMMFFFAVVKVIIYAVSESNESKDDDDDGGIEVNDPILDLPPGVSLPSNKDKSELVL